MKRERQREQKTQRLWGREEQPVLSEPALPALLPRPGSLRIHWVPGSLDPFSSRNTPGLPCLFCWCCSLRLEHSSFSSLHPPVTLCQLTPTPQPLLSRSPTNSICQNISCFWIHIYHYCELCLFTCVLVWWLLPPPLNHTLMENRVLHIVGIREISMKGWSWSWKVWPIHGAGAGRDWGWGSPIAEGFHFSVHLMTLSFFLSWLRIRILWKPNSAVQQVWASVLFDWQGSHGWYVSRRGICIVFCALGLSHPTPDRPPSAVHTELERGSQSWLPASSLNHLLWSLTQASKGKKPGQGARRFPPLPSCHVWPLCALLAPLKIGSLGLNINLVVMKSRASHYLLHLFSTCLAM